MKTELFDATVSALVHELEMVHVEVGNDETLSVGKRNAGVAWRNWKVGQHFLCLDQVENATKVLWA